MGLHWYSSGVIYIYTYIVKRRMEKLSKDLGEKLSSSGYAGGT